ncbi:hypothetical protein U27_04154 [Candidatus Vecturithrix granuli]|uniref:Uncharacterized protein n=1 Tax=Vecturithrix granuli TaxID=1499967 RepID=A0A081BXY4_VECG1|nr:hypothetical protein U27_04154 [Candidatus Vecturithrix granuli]
MSQLFNLGSYSFGKNLKPMPIKNLISLYCLGNVTETDSPCEQLLPPKICRLLRDCVLRVIFEQGRCRPTTELLRPTVAGQLRRYRDLFSPDAPEDYTDSLTFELVKQLEPQRLIDHPTLPGLKSYFNVTAAHAVVDLLEDLALLLARTCGNCIHLSSVKPYVCQHTEMPWYRQTCIPSEKACREGFEAYTLEPLTFMTPAPPAAEISVAALELENLLLLLAKRAEQEQGPKRKQIYERQFSIFSAFCHLIMQGYTRKEVFDEILRLLDVGHKLLKKDLQEIKKFFVQKKVL